MSKGWFFKTILIYELIAFLVWNILVRTEADFEQWAYDNIHTIAYIWWATTLLVVTLSFVIQWSLNKWRVRARIRLLRDPRGPGGKQQYGLAIHQKHVDNLSSFYGNRSHYHYRWHEMDRSIMSGLEIFAVGILAWWTIQIIVPGLQNSSTSLEEYPLGADQSSGTQQIKYDTRISQSFAVLDEPCDRADHSHLLHHTQVIGKGIKRPASKTNASAKILPTVIYIIVLRTMCVGRFLTSSFTVFYGLA